MNDFKTADYIRNHSFSDAFRNHQFSNHNSLKSGLAINYLKGISNHFDYSVNAAGSYLDYSLHNGQELGKGNLLLETDVSVIGKVNTDKHVISPYLQAGVGVSKYNKYFGAFIPLGTGLQINFSNEVYFLMNAQYRIAATNKVNNHFYYSVGIAGNILKKKRKKPSTKPSTNIIPISYDRDNDGIPDSLDACPDVPGLKQRKGCPDRDGDGIPDHEDKCPIVPGILKYHGCPVPDTDGDGIDDDEDSCRTIPGVLKYHGCPIPDSDGDSINDELDKCPFQPGTIENQGCPVIADTIKKKIELAAKNILFKTGSYELLPQSFPSLKEVVHVLKLNPNLKLLIEGHTDNVGTAQNNQLLSENRAQAVMDYLISSREINKNRLSSEGCGFSKPVATNKTNEGRKINRRVELKLYY